MAKESTAVCAHARVSLPPSRETGHSAGAGFSNEEKVSQLGLSAILDHEQRVPQMADQPLG